MVCQCGAIGFVGLVVPHVARLAAGRAARASLALTAAIGAVFLLVTDTVARLAIAPGELPAGVVTAAVGVPVFVGLLARARGRVGCPSRPGLGRRRV